MARWSQQELRVHVPPAELDSDAPRVEAEEARRLISVLRIEGGERVHLFDGTGRSRKAVLRRGGRHLFCEPAGPVMTAPAPRAVITLAFGQVKKPALEFILQKGTELGVHRFQPIECARSVAAWEEDRAGRKRERWQELCLHAARQCERDDTPELRAPVPLAGWLDTPRAACFAAIERSQAPRLDMDALPSLAGEVGLLTGPEGGFEPAEMERILAAGCAPVSLGSRILRAETAAVVLAALVLYGLQAFSPEKNP
ncbi:MAG: Ribosomal RNA small subunit methyltransferase E [Myxococcota bacterium]|nr:Ribosomal RNA small subunit methyltransferase E [Myxococcota bacterium]